MLSVFIVAWAATQIALFTYRYVSTARSRSSSGVLRLLGWTLPLAKAAAVCINFNTSLLVSSKCTIFWQHVHSWVHFKAVRSMIMSIQNNHAKYGAAVIIFSGVHIIAHIVNYAKAAKYGSISLLLSGTTITGMVMSIVLLMIGSTSFDEKLRKRQYEKYLFVHLLSALYVILLCIHQAFCLLKSNNGKCNPPTSWIWLVGPGMVFNLEQVVIWIRTHFSTKLLRVIVHPSHVIELQFAKPSLCFKPGQFVHIKVPIVSCHQWHPFTLTSSPIDDIHSVHIQVCGDWTREFSRKLHIEFGPDGTAFCDPIDCLPDILVDGPYGPEWDRMLGDVIIAIGAGIGQTPFASILKTWWYIWQLFILHHP